VSLGGLVGRFGLSGLLELVAQFGTVSKAILFEETLSDLTEVISFFADVSSFSDSRIIWSNFSLDYNKLLIQS
jgi:hypothetical protein